MFHRFKVITFIIAIPLLLLGLVMSFTQAAENVYGTFLGDEQVEKGYAIAVDADGNAYVTGYTESVVFPTLTLQLEEHGVDVWTARFNADGSNVDYILWFNAISTADEDYGYGVTVGDDGSAYVVGQTRSPDFCSIFGVVPGIDDSYNGSGDAFLMKVKPDGSGLDYCTFLGGTDWETAWGVALDPAGNVYVVGGTWSTDFTAGATTINDQHIGQRDLYIVRINPAGTVVEHASYIGGTGQEEARGLAVDDEGVVSITGWTNSDDFITTTGVIGTGYNGGFDAFVVKVDTATPDLIYSTYLGGTDEDRAFALAMDPAGNTYVAGLTLSPDFPVTPGSFQTTLPGGRDGFVAKLNPAGTALQYATFLGGSNAEQVNAIALDGLNNAYLTGETISTDFPTTTLALSPTLPGDESAFVTILNTPGSHLLYGSYLGGSAEDQGNSIAVGNAGLVYIAGATRSPDFPVSSGAYDISHNGDYDVFVTGQMITVANPLIADFVAAPLSGTAPLAVQFTNLSTGDYQTVTWEFGDGTMSQELNPVHVYAAGSYTVTLTIDGPAGSVSLTKPAYINVQSALFLPLLQRP